MFVYPTTLRPQLPSIIFAVVEDGTNASDESFLSVYRSALAVVSYNVDCQSFELLKDQNKLGISELVSRYIRVSLDSHYRIRSDQDLSWFMLRFFNRGYQHQVFEVVE